LIVALLLIGALALAACGDDDDDDDTGQATATRATSAAATNTTAAPQAATGSGGGEAPDYGSLSGEVVADGSSTVAPVAQAVAEEFSAVAGDVQVSIATSGTGGGFESFCAGETDISNASRVIAEDEIAMCADAGVEYTELHVATDALTVVVNAANDWVECITVDDLQQIWMPESTVRRWSDINQAWPDEEINLYGPGTDSGTFDYFTEEINGEAGASRSDYTASEDDNVLVQGIAGDEHALGYFGYAYYAENQDTLKALAIDAGAGCVAPTPQTAVDGTYQPLARPLYIYVNNESLARPELYGFVYFWLTEGPALTNEIGYVALDASEYEADLQAIARFAP
jgi:phosphate transport system substrate-binding protein